MIESFNFVPTSRDCLSYSSSLNIIAICTPKLIVLLGPKRSRGYIGLEKILGVSSSSGTDNCLLQVEFWKPESTKQDQLIILTAAGKVIGLEFVGLEVFDEDSWIRCSIAEQKKSINRSFSLIQSFEGKLYMKPRESPSLFVQCGSNEEVNFTPPNTFFHHGESIVAILPAGLSVTNMGRVITSSGNVIIDDCILRFGSYHYMKEEDLYLSKFNIVYAVNISDGSVRLLKKICIEQSISEVVGILPYKRTESGTSLLIIMENGQYFELRLIESSFTLQKVHNFLRKSVEEVDPVAETPETLVNTQITVVRPIEISPNQWILAEIIHFPSEEDKDDICNIHIFAFEDGVLVEKSDMPYGKDLVHDLTVERNIGKCPECGGDLIRKEGSVLVYCEREGHFFEVGHNGDIIHGFADIGKCASCGAKYSAKKQQTCTFCKVSLQIAGSTLTNTL